MTNKWRLGEAFAHFGGAKGKNPRWSWSARIPDGSGVVMTFWQDEFDYKSAPPSYSSTKELRGAAWIKRPGNRERLENLIWARDHCDGVLHVVIAVARDVTAEPRSVLECFPQEKMRMKLVSLDEQTGEFRAELVA